MVGEGGGNGNKRRKRDLSPLSKIKRDDKRSNTEHYLEPSRLLGWGWCFCWCSDSIEFIDRFLG